MRTKSLFFVVVLLTSCKTDYTPKPRAFVKLNLPEKVYHKLDVDCPFAFEFPVYSKLLRKESSCSMDLTFPMQNGTLYISYFALEDNFMIHTQKSRELAYKHDIVADRISEQLYVNDSLNVYGILFDYEGVAATSAQFYLTDSVNHFFRGALYFNTQVSDSILPISLFLKYDIKHLIETFHWKDM